MEYILDKYRLIFLKKLNRYIPDKGYINKHTLETITMEERSINNYYYFINNNKVYDRTLYASNTYIYKNIGKIANQNLILWNKI